MKDFETIPHHPMVDTLVNILSARTQNPDKNFFTILTCYHLTKLASMMRCRVDAQGFGNLLVNFYGMELEVVGYSHNELADVPLLIVEASPLGGCCTRPASTPP